MAKASHRYSDVIKSKQQIIDWFKQGCVKKEDLVIGAENEKFIFYKDDHSTVPYEGSNGRAGIKDLLEYIRDEFNWEPKYEDGNLIRLEKGGASITLEPGGQIELSGAPLKNLHDVASETSEHFEQLLEACEALEMDSLGLGYHPTQKLEDAPLMPMSRHETFYKFFGEHGYTNALNLMVSTSSTQVNLGYTSEEDMVKKLRVSLALQPIAVAIFANSPFCEGALSEAKSHRSHITENAACGRYGFMMPVAFDEDFSFEKYTDFISNMPVIGFYEDEHFVFLGMDNIPFDKCVRDHIAHSDKERPLTMDDWFNHINTVWPEVRMRQWLEMRGSDVASSTEMITALPAFWIGILYDDEALDKAYDMIKDWTNEDREYLRMQAAINGLQTEFLGTTIQEIAKNALALSELGLKNRHILNDNGEDESKYLEPVKDVITTGLTQADKLKDKYKNEWKKDISQIFTELSYGAKKRHLLHERGVANSNIPEAKASIAKMRSRRSNKVAPRKK